MLAWHSPTKKIVYSWYIVFRDVNIPREQEFQPKEEEPKKIDFELEGEESNSTGEYKEPQFLSTHPKGSRRSKPLKGDRRNHDR